MKSPRQKLYQRMKKMRRDLFEPLTKRALSEVHTHTLFSHKQMRANRERDIYFSIRLTSVADCMLSATKSDSFESNRYHFHALCVSGGPIFYIMSRGAARV